MINLTGSTTLLSNTIQCYSCGHFLSILDDVTLTSDIILCTPDVTSLYTNIPNDMDISAVRRSLSIHVQRL